MTGNGNGDDVPTDVLRPASFRGKRFFIVDGVEHRIDGHFHIDFDPNEFHDALDNKLERPLRGVIDLDGNVTLNLELSLRGVRMVERMVCDGCGDQFRPADLERQVVAFLSKRFFRKRLTESVRDQIVDSVRPWWDRFTAGEDRCFNCRTGGPIRPAESER